MFGRRSWGGTVSAPGNMVHYAEEFIDIWNSPVIVAGKGHIIRKIAEKLRARGARDFPTSRLAEAGTSSPCSRLEDSGVRADCIGPLNPVIPSVPQQPTADTCPDHSANSQ